MNEDSDNGGTTRRGFVGMGLALAAASVLARTGAAQEGKGQPGDTPGKAPEPVGLYPHARRVGNLLFLSGVGPRERGSKKIPGVELGQKINATQAGIDAVGNGDIDQAIFAGKRNGGLGAFFGQGKQAGPLPSAHDH